MKPKIILLLCFAVPLFCMAQVRWTHEYGYDAAGNRTSCKLVITMPQAPPTPPDSTETEPPAADLTPQSAEYFVEKIAQVEIKIYPNPATEKITLEFSGGVETWRAASLRLYSLSGQLLQEQPVHSSTTIVSLAGFAKGTYILKVQVNGHTEDWKIIKN